MPLRAYRKQRGIRQGRWLLEITVSDSQSLLSKKSLHSRSAAWGASLQIDKNYQLPMRYYNASNNPVMSLEAGAPIQSVIIRIERAHPRTIAKLRRSRRIIDAWPDSNVHFHGEANAQSPDQWHDVGKSLQVYETWHRFTPYTDSLPGKGASIGIVDGGVSSDSLRQTIAYRGLGSSLGHVIVQEGASIDPEVRPGTDTLNTHGTRCAFDALLACPGAEIHDYRFSTASNYGGSPFNTTWVSDAARVIEHALHRTDRKPQVLSCSFSVGDVDHTHYFTRKIQEAIAQRMLVVFSAGNNGDRSDSGRFIGGTNGTPSVLCVGAARLDGSYPNYSSSGPAIGGGMKPDVCCYTDFAGYTDCDNKTSTAAAVAAGVVALLWTIYPDAHQDLMIEALRRTASNSGRWSRRTGYGAIDLPAAAHFLQTHFRRSPGDRAY